MKKYQAGLAMSEMFANMDELDYLLNSKSEEEMKSRMLEIRDFISELTHLDPLERAMARTRFMTLKKINNK